MKITRLAALAKEQKSMMLINTIRDESIIRQHLMIGQAVYPLDGFPLMQESELLTLLDVPVEKHMEYYVHSREMWDAMRQYTADNDAEDKEASVCETGISVPWMDVVPMYTQQGVMFIGNDYKRIIDNEKGVGWWSRKTLSGAVVLVAKKGYQTIATIMPDNRWMTDGVCDDLWHIAQAARGMYDRNRESEMQGEQQTMDGAKLLEDPEKTTAIVLS